MNELYDYRYNVTVQRPLCDVHAMYLKNELAYEASIAYYSIKPSINFTELLGTVWEK